MSIVLVTFSPSGAVPRYLYQWPNVCWDFLPACYFLPGGHRFFLSMI